LPNGHAPASGGPKWENHNIYTVYIHTNHGVLTFSQHLILPLAWPRPPQDGFEMEEEDFKVGAAKSPPKGWASKPHFYHEIKPLDSTGVFWIFGTKWGPPVISWFISPRNYSYRYHKP